MINLKPMLTATQNISYLEGLNAEQREAVETTDGPVLVLSGAGTGKTRVLTTRIAHILLSRKAFSGQILAVTFTNKAAKEMIHRVQSLVGPSSEGMWIGTFHAVAARMLRRHAEAVGLKQSFSIMDEDDQLRLIKQILREMNIDEKRYPPRVFNSIIQGLKDKAITSGMANKDNASYCDGRAAEVYKRYQASLTSMNACDFGDLLLHTLTIFKANPAILEEYAKRFHYIMVDEYQDTNVAQYMWLKLLALHHGNICCVGDDDQSIYSWRGADIGNILNFNRDYPEAKTVRLERNYRSTPEILAVASAVIANNSGRLGKTLWTDDPESSKVEVITAQDDRQEASLIASKVRDYELSGSNRNEIAVLVRAGFMTRAFEEQFIMNGIPYRIIGGQKFYERSEIKDAVAYLRVINEQADELALTRIINMPKRGVGESTMTAVMADARASGRTLFDTFDTAVNMGRIKGRARETLKKFIADIKHWAKLSPNIRPSQLLELVLSDSGYLDYWRNDKTPEAVGRVENLKELVNAIAEFESLQAFLEHASLESGGNMDDAGGKVSVMTLHAAKGLEFENVFLPGWEEGIFPSPRSMDEKGNEGLEEERRLAYVGITRARRKLTISHAASRRVYNQFQSNLPSRFIDEMPDQHIEHIDKTSYGRRDNSNFQSRVGKIFDENNFDIPFVESANDEYEQKPEAAFSRGKRVFHQTFGHGRIISVSGNHVEVIFDKSGTKKILSEFVSAC